MAGSGSMEKPSEINGLSSQYRIADPVRHPDLTANFSEVS
jgi:hypothetical protein